MSGGLSPPLTRRAPLVKAVSAADGSGAGAGACPGDPMESPGEGGELMMTAAISAAGDGDGDWYGDGAGAGEPPGGGRSARMASLSLSPPPFFLASLLPACEPQALSASGSSRRQRRASEE